MSYRELQKEAKKRGLKSSGTKDQLIERLDEYDFDSQRDYECETEQENKNYMNRRNFNLKPLNLSKSDSVLPKSLVPEEIVKEFENSRIRSKCRGTRIKWS